MQKKLLPIVIIVLLYLVFGISSIAYAQTIEIPTFSVYVDRKQISNLDPELKINNRINKKGVVFSVKYQKSRCKAIVYHRELCSVDSIAINIAGSAKKKDVNIVSASKFDAYRWLERCLRCKEGYYYRSKIILYESENN